MSSSWPSVGSGSVGLVAFVCACEKERESARLFFCCGAYNEVLGVVCAEVDGMILRSRMVDSLVGFWWFLFNVILRFSPVR